MRRPRFPLTVLFTLLFAGCIVSDELTTMAIRPDGSTDIVKFNSNIRSSEQGNKGEEELRSYVEEFDTRKGQDFLTVERAGGTVLDTWWVRREAPYSHIISARLPNAAALEKWGTIEGEEGQLRLTTRFTQNNSKRKLSMFLVPPRDFDLTDIASPTVKDARQKQANGISEIRLAVLGGKITSSQGWTEASDKRSALLDLDQIGEMLRTSPQWIEVFVEWEVK